eukprot:CAMPEP_0194043426 /NCGR_PEP_ID=MMETSP0009_2-20130614/15060_1 /TAXON_ID=210454 /ORGANISM="Grammatophora oceanica, Strain CCMP 410" /LENGTH=615 /DNA_ID=CAMNT_0038687627 /DNA_START=420 /DNA_END=2267 /DNA_ORIENTATION=+
MNQFGDRQSTGISRNREPSPRMGDKRLSQPGGEGHGPPSHPQRHLPSSTLHQHKRRMHESSSKPASRPNAGTSGARPQLPSLPWEVAGGEVFLTPDELGRSQTPHRAPPAFLMPDELGQTRGQNHMAAKPMNSSRRSSRSSRRTYVEFGDDFSAVASELTWEDGMSALRSMRSRDDAQSHSTQHWSMKSRDDAQSHSTHHQSLAPPSLKAGWNERPTPRNDKHFEEIVPVPAYDTQSQSHHHSLKPPPSLKAGWKDNQSPPYNDKSSENSRSYYDDIQDLPSIYPSKEDFEAVNLIRPRMPFSLVMIPLALAIGLGISFWIVTSMSSRHETIASPVSPTTPSPAACENVGILDLEHLQTVNLYCECFGDASPLPDHFDLGRYQRLRAYFQQAVSFETASTTSCEPSNRVLLSMSVQHNFTTGNALDRFLLMVLYQSWDGDNWSGNNRWLSNKTVCSWEGVYCDVDENVDELYFTETLPHGNIPSFLGQLDGIHTLIISGDQVGGTIPSEIGELTGLTKLGMYEAGLTGTIPTTIGLLTNLVSLDLYGNSLSGKLPKSLLQLETLKDVDLRGNNVTDDLLIASQRWPSYVQVTGGNVEAVEASSPPGSTATKSSPP